MIRKTIKRRILMRNERMFWPEWRRKIRRGRKSLQRTTRASRVLVALWILPEEEREKLEDVS